MTVATIERLPLGCFRHPSTDVAYPGWLPGRVECQPAALHLAHHLAGWHAPARGLGGSVPAPVYEGELR